MQASGFSAREHPELGTVDGRKKLPSACVANCVRCDARRGEEWHKAERQTISLQMSATFAPTPPFSMLGGRVPASKVEMVVFFFRWAGVSRRAPNIEKGGAGANVVNLSTAADLVEHLFGAPLRGYVALLSTVAKFNRTCGW